MENYKFTAIGECIISPFSTIHDGSIIGKPFRKLFTGQLFENNTTIISDDVYVGYYCIIGSGSQILPNCIVDDKCIIESDVKIGINCLIAYGAQICAETVIGNNCIIAGFICERTTIGDNCRVFGKIKHAQLDPTNDWDAEESMEPSPLILDNVFVGADALVIGQVELGPKSYICAGSIVTRDVPPYHIAYGVNKSIHFSKWKGKLKDSKFFE